ncbi:hypothetical protein BKA62DRAFT_714942 [Auriculariales sp. MPI-PUGE-AT-0066]|nr:hypothetical protein BKA62DRAFT_714942 [Auriculariales sp. MPI-PUGE-AT-0066]
MSVFAPSFPEAPGLPVHPVDYMTPNVVRELARAADCIALHVGVSSQKKSKSAVVTTTASEIAASVMASSHANDCTETTIPPTAHSALSAAVSVFQECARFLQDRKSHGAFTKLKSLRTAPSILQDYQVAFVELVAILKVKDGRCALIDDPDAALADGCEKDTRLASRYFLQI